MVSVSDAAASTSSVMTQSSAAAQEMMGLARELDALVQQFQLERV
jgi:methyl-accepting chemotaxis protein